MNTGSFQPVAYVKRKLVILGQLQASAVFHNTIILRDRVLDVFNLDHWLLMNPSNIILVLINICVCKLIDLWFVIGIKTVSFVYVTL